MSGGQGEWALVSVFMLVALLAFLIIGANDQSNYNAARCFIAAERAGATDVVYPGSWVWSHDCQIVVDGVLRDVDTSTVEFRTVAP